MSSLILVLGSSTGISSVFTRKIELHIALYANFMENQEIAAPSKKEIAAGQQCILAKQIIFPLLLAM
jgi:hypothetical protein